MSTAAGASNMPTETTHTRLQQPAARNLVYCFLFIIVAILLPLPAIAQTSSSTCGPKFPEACTCGHESYENSLAYVVNCTNAGLRNTTVLTLMPAEVEILIFTGNYIPELPWNVFGSFNDYKNLKIVDMSNNHIRDIRGKSYHRVQHVERLILNHNNLSISRAGDTVNHHHARVFSSFVNLESLHLTDAFADNTSPEFSEDLHDIFQQSELLKLQKLHLEQNEIKNFKDRSVFCALPSLTDLYLGDNNLNEINFEIGCLPNLRFLDLERNKFEYVKTTDLMLLNELESRSNRSVLLIVDFNLNPFVCDCRVSPFQMWVQATNVSVRHKEKLICYRNKNEPLPLMQLDLKSECASAVAAAQVLFDTAAETQHYRMSEHFEPHINGHTATLIFLLIVLTMILVGLLVALVYISRDKLKFMITPVFDNVAKKVQYTSIKDEDCPEVHV